MCGRSIADHLQKVFLLSRKKKLGLGAKLALLAQASPSRLVVPFSVSTGKGSSETPAGTDPVATGEPSPGTGETTAAPAEANMFDPETMEYTVDNLKMETESDPTRMAEVYLNRHNAWNMAGTQEDRGELYRTYIDTYSANENAEGEAIGHWDFGKDKSNEYVDIFAESLAGSDWKQNVDTVKWVEDRRIQNSVNFGAFMRTYDPAYDSQTDALYNQTDTLSGKVEIMSEETVKAGTLQTLKIPIHSVATNQVKSEPTLPEYDYKVDLITTFEHLGNGETVVVSEEYSDMYDVVLPPDHFSGN